MQKEGLGNGHDLVGRTCARLGTDHADPRVLCERLTCREKSGDAAAPSVSLRLDDVCDWLRRHIKHDFRDGNVCAIDGWIFSVTEMRLMAVHPGAADAV